MQEKERIVSNPLFTPIFPALIFKGDDTMRCAICGTQIKPWFEVCYECYSPISSSKIPEPIVADNFMKEMKIDGW